MLEVLGNWRFISCHGQLAKDIFEISRGFPKAETYSLTDQVRRSSRSVGAQIAEAWAKRRYEKPFISKLTDADGEQLETQRWIEIAADSGYVSEESAKCLIAGYASIGKMVYSMINKAPTFCNIHKLP